MAIIAGIDEAGYGPLLGPLVVTGTEFEVPDDRADESLWLLLQNSVTAHPSRHDLRLPILDSKKLYVRQEGLTALERTALVMLKVSGLLPPTFRSYLTAFCPRQIEQLDSYPWYCDFDPSLPLEAGEADVATRATAVRRDLAAVGVTFRTIHVEPLLEGHFNRLVAATRNKASALLTLTLRIIQRLLVGSADQSTRICVDRQGGRAHYAAILLTAFDSYDLCILEESEQLSAYRLTPRGSSSGVGGSHVIEFRTSGESAHLPVALASIYSKYLRELFMHGFNVYWRRHLPELTRTAGYYEDGLRFLRDIEPIIVRSRIDRGLLVRMK